MIRFDIVGDKTKRLEIANKFHYALAGSPGYIGSEIFLNHSDDKTVFIVGNDNSGDVRYVIDVESFKVDEQAR